MSHWRDPVRKAEYNRAYRAAHRELLCAKSRAWHAVNRERANARRRVRHEAYRALDRAKARVYAKDNRARAIARAQNWYAENREYKALYDRLHRFHSSAVRRALMTDSQYRDAVNAKRRARYAARKLEMRDAAD